jgi:hypothetical protein
MHRRRLRSTVLEDAGLVEGVVVAATRTVTWPFARDCVDVAVDLQPN